MWNGPSYFVYLKTFTYLKWKRVPANIRFIEMLQQFGGLCDKIYLIYINRGFWMAHSKYICIFLVTKKNTTYGFLAYISKIPWWRIVRRISIPSEELWDSSQRYGHDDQRTFWNIENMSQAKTENCSTLLSMTGKALTRWFSTRFPPPRGDDEVT